MTSNIIQFADYRETRLKDAGRFDLNELAAMSYSGALEWAGADFARLVAVAEARDYRPEWVVHQLADRGHELSARQAQTIDSMIVAAGPYLTQRERWLMKQLSNSPDATDEQLAALAIDAHAYRFCRDFRRCVGNDVRKLTAMGLIERRSERQHA
jgi:hypothetical protein